MSVIRVCYKNENHNCFCDDAIYLVIKDVGRFIWKLCEWQGCYRSFVQWQALLTSHGVGVGFVVPISGALQITPRCDMDINDLDIVNIHINTGVRVANQLFMSAGHNCMMASSDRIKSVNLESLKK